MAETGYAVTQVLGLAGKGFKAVVTVLKDVKENMLLMNEKRAYHKELKLLKKKNQLEILELKNMVPK